MTHLHFCRCNYRNRNHGTVFSMYQCDRCSSDITTWQFIIGRTTSFQCLTDIYWLCTQEHRKAPRAPALATQEEGPGPSLQSTTIGSSCSSNKDASTFQAAFQGPFQQTIPRASQGAVAAFLTCCLVSSTENLYLEDDTFPKLMLLLLILFDGINLKIPFAVNICCYEMMFMNSGSC